MQYLFPKMKRKLPVVRNFLQKKYIKLFTHSNIFDRLK